MIGEGKLLFYLCLFFCVKCFFNYGLFINSNNSNRFEEDGRNKKGPGPGPGGTGPNNARVDTRGGPQDFANKQFSNLPPRLLRQQQQQNIQSSFTGNPRKTPSPVTAQQLPGKFSYRLMIIKSTIYLL